LRPWQRQDSIRQMRQMQADERLPEPRVTAPDTAVQTPPVSPLQTASRRIRARKPHTYNEFRRPRQSPIRSYDHATRSRLYNTGRFCINEFLSGIQKAFVYKRGDRLGSGRGLDGFSDGREFRQAVLVADFLARRSRPQSRRLRRAHSSELRLTERTPDPFRLKICRRRRAMGPFWCPTPS
jgi:hypothetical protein